MKDSNNLHKIRPAGRHLITIGRDLIQDSYAAVVELVKNSYDADSKDVNISFIGQPDSNQYKVVISDHGHGMSRDTVIDKWMVPSTADKLDRKISPGGRTMQGRKGVGRYAASILGSDLLLETISLNGEKTTVFVEWNSFETADYLDEVEILVETKNTNEPPGTTLTISGKISDLKDWDKRQFDKLRFELKKLIPPVKIEGKSVLDIDCFDINLAIKNIKGIDDISEKIEPYPIFDLYDYKISGQIHSNGSGELVYKIQKARNTTTESIPIQLHSPTGCGTLSFDIRVYDREAESIESLINRGLRDEHGSYVGKLQARQLLNESNGIGVYRNGFRIRPLGDSDFDWLKLNEQRVQNPSLRIGSNQVIGYVLIQSEEQSDLIEKSARDGLKENKAFDQLKHISKLVIAELEERRFRYRRKAGLSKKALKVEKELEKIFSFESLKTGIRKTLLNNGIAESAANEVLELINKEEEEKNKSIEEVRNAVATYQGQATLGKIINVILHEGRRPLNYFKNEAPRIKRFSNKLTETNDKKYIEKIHEISEGVERNSTALSELFARIDPLASGKRGPKRELNLKKELISAFSIFRKEMQDHKISYYIECDESATLMGWSQDINAIFVNLIDNSIFWMNEKNTQSKRIEIFVETRGSEILYIDYRDTGPGIEPNLIEDNLIFEPEFTTKMNGSGIGLAISGESAERNSLELNALQSDTGAYFRLQAKGVF
ncbi:sensor histidine kinase [Chromobacterium violaceum]|uniref:sensor histidine kinase n=1 Tax=Chromobacterium violaceum TaxID=536 RepID=UPI0009D95861|nr:sensor histidine kinase [Chromobacterium violaceum]OQS19792.1 ATP-binding protein [Chromobacterium violaceum]